MKITEENINSKKLGVFAIWAIGVGMVISGESFGWNLGWAITGPLLFFIPVAVAALMYFGLIQNLIELACVYPNASGPHTYVEKAFGKKWGYFIGLAILFEFLFATPAIASSLGEYLGFLLDDLTMSPWIATIFILFFSIINIFEMHVGVRLLIILTLLAIAELFLYQGSVASSFQMDNIINSGNDSSLSMQSFVEAIPYAIWLFLAIEGISLMTNAIDKKGFRKTISRGYNFAFFTLLILALLVLFLAAGGIDWNLPESIEILNENHPMPASMALILGKEHFLVQLFTFIGLFGLIASLQGIAFAATTQLEPLLKNVKFKGVSNRAMASSLVFIICLIAIWSSQTGFLIELSVFGAVCMYMAVSTSLLFLRKKQVLISPANFENGFYQHKDFNAKFSTFSSVVAVVISLICILAFAYLQFTAFIIFIACSLIYVFLIRK